MLNWFKTKWSYDWRRLAGDSAGGLIAALIAIPYGLAMASMMGLPPAFGLYSSVITAPVTALLGRNPVLIGGAASATVPFIALAVREQGIGGGAKVTIVCAVFMLAFSFLRLGRWVSYVPHTVVSGFSCGIGAMMVISQLGTMTGIASPVSASSLLTLWAWVQSITNLRWEPLLIGGVAVAASFLCSSISHRVPGPLVGVGAALGVAQLLRLNESEVGALPLSLPPFAGFSWKPSDVYEVLPAGFGLALISSLNLLITSRVVEHFRGRHKPIKAAENDQEVGAYGIANLCAGMFGFPLSLGIPARSLANVRCGGTTRLSNVIHAAAILLLVGAGSGLLQHIPVAALAGVIVYVGICLLDWSIWRRLHRMQPSEAAAFLATAGSVLTVSAVGAVAVGCAVHYFPRLYRRFGESGRLQPAEGKA